MQAQANGLGNEESRAAEAPTGRRSGFSRGAPLGLPVFASSVPRPSGCFTASLPEEFRDEEPKSWAWAYVAAGSASAVITSALWLALRAIDARRARDGSASERIQPDKEE